MNINHFFPCRSPKGLLFFCAFFVGVGRRFYDISFVIYSNSSKGVWLYLKAVMFLKSTKKQKYDSIDHMAIYIFDDTIYFIASSPLFIANGVYDKEVDIILNTFGCDLK